MPETEVRAPAIYDRERELTDPELASSGRHRRPAPDWGGDELFARGSRRRRDRAQARHVSQAEPPHGLVRAERGTGGATDEWTVRTRDAARARSEARLDRPPLDPGPAARPHGIDPGEPRRADRGDVAPDPADSVRAYAATDAPEPASDPSLAEPPAGGRRTVLITGRPGTQRTGTPWARPPTERRRPPRTIDERLGARPDRVAAWAFGLGLLLILIAVTTADAATL